MNSLFLVILALSLAASLASAVLVLAACIQSDRFEEQQPRRSKSPQPEFDPEFVDAYPFSAGKFDCAELYVLDDGYRRSAPGNFDDVAKSDQKVKMA